MKQKIKMFWKEWGMTKEEMGMFIDGLLVILTPFLFRIFLAFFGI